MADEIFLDTILTDKICLDPSMIRHGVQEVILDKLRDKFEGVCTHHGYIKPNSIIIQKCSLGQVRTFSLNGAVVYSVLYKARVCNPAIGSIITAKIINMNKFGYLAESMSILEIIIPKDANTKEYNQFDLISVQIIGKKFELGDKKLSIVGKIIAEEVHVVVNDNESTYVNDNDDDEDQVNNDDDSDSSEDGSDKESSTSEAQESDSESSAESESEEEDDENADGDADDDDVEEDDEDTSVGGNDD